MGFVDFADQPRFDIDIMSRYAERIVIASSPWQAWFASMRHIYRWEDPVKTGKWLCVWFMVWYADYMMTFMVCVIETG